MAGDEKLWALIERQNWGVLATLKKDGRPQLSNVNYAFDPTSRTFRISITDGRAKTANIRRDPRVSYHITTGDGGAYAVAEGIAELSPVAQDRHDAVVEELIDIFRLVQGEHSDWDDYRAAMVNDRRLILRLPVDRVYGWGGY